MRHSSLIDDDQGFALVTALILSLIVGGIALMIQLGVRQTTSYANALEDDAQMKSALEAGLNRAISAYASSDDPMRAQLVADGRPVHWQFEDKVLRLSVQAESGKWDLNAANRTQISSLLTALFEDENFCSSVLDRIDSFRSSGQAIDTIEMVLSPLDRLSARRRIIEDHFTTFTNQIGIDPKTAPKETIEAIQGMPAIAKRELITQRSADQPLTVNVQGDAVFVTEKPIYTFRAETEQGFGAVGAMSMLVAYPENRLFVVFSRERTVPREE